MARKKKHPEHVNLERYLISYADFITLLFATFVVLYALSQVDISSFKALEDSMKQAFSAPSLMEGSEGVMEAQSDTIFEEQQADSMITPLMMEYMSQKYEEQSMREIEKNINDKIKAEEIDGVEATQTDRGLVIKFDDAYLFKVGSAELTPAAKNKLDKVGAAIGKKFILHNMRVEGHTDNAPIKSTMFPSNWELSSARASAIIRYYIARFGFMPSLFTAIGYADTRPISDNNSPSGKAKNRRIEILILKNKYKTQEYSTNSIMKMSQQDQEKMQAKRMDTINRIESISDAAKNLSGGNTQEEKKAIILNQVYDKEIKRLSNETKGLENKKRQEITGHGLWLKPPAHAPRPQDFKFQ